MPWYHDEWFLDYLQEWITLIRLWYFYSQASDVLMSNYTNHKHVGWMGFIKIMRQKSIIVHKTHILTQICQIKKKNTTSAQNIIELINIIILIIFLKTYQKRNKKEKIARTKQMMERLLYKF